MLDTLQRLFQKGVRFGTVIDIGCADGSFFLELLTRGLVPGASSLNIDANSLYEESLREIASVVGGKYWIGAVTDREGEIELTTSVHPYWASLRPKDDRYWERINGLSGEKVKVPATTLDQLLEKLALDPPYLLKLDVQGAEESVLRGARQTLNNTHAAIVEADIEDFENINARLIEGGFSLYDACHLHRHADGTLSWFHPIYINHKLDYIRPRALWVEGDNDGVVNAQVERRRTVLKKNAEMLDHIRRRWSLAGVQATRRNMPCLCGSGKKFKHCCGARA